MLEKLQESAARLELAEEVAGFGVWEGESCRRHRDHFAGMARLHGRPEGAPLHMNLDDWNAANDPAQVAAVYEAAARCRANNGNFYGRG